ncbi:MAG: CRTAC1 family protein, partial [Ignavibacteriae bacterium]|nr:CRTAC1 family protein [Ignavibacteriota bacterium]
MRPAYYLLALATFVSTAAFSQVTFTDVSATAGSGIGDGTTRSISWVDYNSDGYLDLYVPTAGNAPNKLYKNNGNGTFTDVAAAVGLNDLTNTITSTWADFDNDGDQDLFTTATSAGATLWRNNRVGGFDSTFTNITSTSGVSISGSQMGAWADYNLDSHLDLYTPVSSSSSTSDALFRNNGNSTFVNVADSAGVNHQISSSLEQAVHWGDYNKDGFPDLFIGNLQTSGQSYFHRNNGNGTFTEIAGALGFAGAARGAQWVDYNNDGRWDLSVAGYAGSTTMPIKLYRNNGDGTFTDVAASAGITDAVISWGVTWADYNNDGFEDCFVAVSGQSTSCLLYKNNGDGTFTNATTEAGLNGLVQLSAAWGDYDGDGDMDLYTSGSASSGNHLFRNNADSTKKWLEVNLLGVFATNRSGVGAQVEVVVGSNRMMREVNTGIGYRSQNMLTAHFGLGTSDVIDSLIIRWPKRNAFRLALTRISANRVLTIPDFIDDVDEVSVAPS